ncbi:hypothetical protein B0H19DRAFT_1071239 [Mycena capillaripes]|nr:hypothetical protein B0H19DRAFT_1071239 [Mycena capillaripes]
MPSSSLAFWIEPLAPVEFLQSSVKARVPGSPGGFRSQGYGRESKACCLLGRAETLATGGIEGPVRRKVGPSEKCWAGSEIFDWTEGVSFEFRRKKWQKIEHKPKTVYKYYQIRSRIGGTEDFRRHTVIFVVGRDPKRTENMIDQPNSSSNRFQSFSILS